MQTKNIVNVYFSPRGTTKAVALDIASVFDQEAQELDLIRSPIDEDIKIGRDGLLIVSMPVYVGRLPEVASLQLKRLKGDNTPAIAAVVYGNREYDDALIELRDILQANGFCVVGAGAFIAQHSIFSKIAVGRPDEKDKAAMSDFANVCKHILASDLTLPCELISVKGNIPYLQPPRVPMKPSTSNACSKCGLCATLCPVHAIDKNDGKKFDKDVCISCGACIQCCPKHAKSFSGLVYNIAAKKFGEKCAQRKDAEVFYINHQHS